METRFSASLLMLRRIPSRLEISFWSAVTRWMSESHLFQQVVLEAYSLNAYFAGNRRKVIRLSMLWVGAGWLAGFLLGLLSL